MTLTASEESDVLEEKSELLGQADKVPCKSKS